MQGELTWLAGYMSADSRPSLYKLHTFEVDLIFYFALHLRMFQVVKVNVIHVYSSGWCTVSSASQVGIGQCGKNRQQFTSCKMSSRLMAISCMTLSKNLLKEIRVKCMLNILFTVVMLNRIFVFSFHFSHSLFIAGLLCLWCLVNFWHVPQSLSQG